MNHRRQALAKEILQQKLAHVPEAVREATRLAQESQADKGTARQNELLDLYPMVKLISTITGLLVEYDKVAYRKFEKEQQAIDDLRTTKSARG